MGVISPTGLIYVAVVGPGRASAGECRAAEQVGRRIGEAGAVLVCGGLGGVMEAACRGGRAGGATTLGILPGTDRSAANDFVDVAVATGIGEARNALVVATADAVVAVGGEFGTLSEIALALKAGRPVVGLESWELQRRGTAVAGVRRATGPDEAAALALALAVGGTAP
ncbi:MAG TPA: TIGR00725 family protein [Acidimicrobiales bacterium]|nr:TIGR00725 family protein [Acidimicrobiales bacterium]